MKAGVQAGNWKYEQEIGSGAFGIVTYWRNKVTGDKLVIKQCRQKLDGKSHGRWREEIKLMNEMKHDNLVSGKPIPTEIVKVMKNAEDLLGLEFCDNDLRKVLSNTEHCCGLREKSVLNILRDVSSGMKFLHETQRVVHRDLKPENILLCHRGDTTIYKITDLGYAKSIDANSICMSFVGTLQYLAPELYADAGYTYTADYWSFGTVMFECITGLRPFLLTESAFEWYKWIQRKQDEQIWGCFEENVGTVFLTELPTPNQLSTPVLAAFKDWLQLVLKKDHRKRGKNADGGVECFLRVDCILQLKVIHVFDMLSCKHVAYQCQHRDIASNLKFFLEKELNFAKDDQLLIFAASGETLEDSQPLEQKALQKDTIFLFNKSRYAKYSINTEIPPKVQEILDAPDELFCTAKLKKAYAHSLFYCRSVAQNYKSLIQGSRALMISLKSMRRPLQHLKDELSRNTTKLETIIEVYEKSCNSDIKCLTQDQNMELDTYTKEWNSQLKEIQSFSRLTDVKVRLKEIQALEGRCATLLKTVANIPPQDASLAEMGMHAERLYHSLRASEKEPNSKLQSSRMMSDTVRNCIDHQASLFKMFSEHLMGVMQCYTEIGSLNTTIEKEVSNLKGKYNFIMESQLHRQGSLWRRLIAKESIPTASQPNLLSSLQGAFEKNENEIPTDDSCRFAPDVILNGMTSNFQRLGRLVRDESDDAVTSPPLPSATVSVVMATPAQQRQTSTCSSLEEKGSPIQSTKGGSERRRTTSEPTSHYPHTQYPYSANQPVAINPSQRQPQSLPVERQPSLYFSNETLFSYPDQPPSQFNQHPQFNQPPSQFNQPRSQFNQPPSQFNQPPSRSNHLPPQFGQPQFNRCPSEFSSFCISDVEPPLGSMSIRPSTQTDHQGSLRSINLSPTRQPDHHVFNPTPVGDQSRFDSMYSMSQYPSMHQRDHSHNYGRWPAQQQTPGYSTRRHPDEQPVRYVSQIRPSQSGYFNELRPTQVDAYGNRTVAGYGDASDPAPCVNSYNLRVRDGGSSRQFRANVPRNHESFHHPDNSPYSTQQQQTRVDEGHDVPMRMFQQQRTLSSGLDDVIAN